jgi:8-oxo-dGTP pyrophosphatase MutT (NUDIX family)
MPKAIGRTLRGAEAEGALVMLYYTDELGPQFVMGEETSYVTEDKTFIEKYKTEQKESIYETFAINGVLPKDNDALHVTFAKLCVDLERIYPELGHVTYGEFKQSSKPGKISAKARYVVRDRRNRLGFPKGGYKPPSEPDADASLNDTAMREVKEETSLLLDPLRLIDANYISSAPKGDRYAVFHYELTPEEYTLITSTGIFAKKNAERENELHNVQFIRVPEERRDSFFTNNVSKNAFIHTKGKIAKVAKKGGAKKKTTRKNVKGIKTKVSVAKTTLKHSKFIITSKFYTERQSSLLCGQHALNHLVQEPKFISKDPNTKTYLQADGKIDLQGYCNHVLKGAKKDLGTAAAEAISCPKSGNYQADILVKVLKEELQYNVQELPFNTRGIAPLKEVLSKPTQNLLGLLINVGASHWVAVSSRIEKDKHVYIDSMNLQTKYQAMTNDKLVAHLSKMNPTRMYVVSFPEEGPYYRCRVC